MLNELADVTAEPVRPGLAEDIKRHIPHRLVSHRPGMDTVNVIIDLRVSKLAAAAAIIITTILFVGFLGGRNPQSDSLYQDSKLLVKYCLTGEGIAGSSLSAGIERLYEYLTYDGKDAVYYGGNMDLADTDAVVMHWKLSDGNYKVILANSQIKTVSAEELIKIQAQMLQKKAK